MRYYPILLSKAGEFKAMQELSDLITNDISPVIEVIAGAIQRVETNLITNWAFDDNQILLDFSNYGEMERADITAIRNLFNNLIAAGVNAIPVIQQNSQAGYIALIRALITQHQCGVAIRTSNSSGGLNNFNAQVASLMVQVGTTRQSTILLIDLGYAEDHTYNILSALAIAILNAIPNPDEWMDIVVASGSFPVDVSHLLPPNQVHRIRRFEWDIWNTIIANPNLNRIVKYGDYGNKNPIYGGEGAFPGSCSIKYTTRNEFVIYRGGGAGDHPHGNGQYITFAARLILSPDYSGNTFSWGDTKINTIAHEVVANPKRKPGSATTWVEITQNHHITLLFSLL